MRFIITFLLALPLFAGAQIYKQSSFESPLPANFVGQCRASYSPWNCIEAAATYSHSISTDYAVSGSSSWKSVLKKTDAAISGGQRAEMTYEPKGSAALANINCMRQYIYIPSSNAAWMSENQESIPGFQWHPAHATYTGGSPSLTIEAKAGRFRRVIRHTNGNTTPGAFETMVIKDYGPIVYDKWIGYEIYYDPKGGATNGRVIIDRIIDGKKERMDDYTGRCLQSWSTPPFPKGGQYCWGMSRYVSNVDHVIYIDMVALGTATETTFNSVIGISGPTPIPNQAPVVSAGPNQSISITSATLTGTATDPDNDPMTYQWVKVSGSGTQVISNATSKVATVTGLVSGSSYVFRLTATDSKGAASSATTGVAVSASNTPPVSNAGISRQLSKGADSVHMDGEATDAQDADCCAIHYWTLVSGPNTPTFNSGDWNPVVTNMKPGTYIFKLTITDSGGLTSESTVSYTIPVVNQKPVATPYPPYILVATADSTQIKSVNADADGKIVSIQWTQISGPTTATIRTPTLDSTIVANLQTGGSYLFRISITDNSGDSAFATVSVVVNNPPTVQLDTTLYTAFSKDVVSVAIPNATVGDADGTIASAQWTVVEAPAGVTPVFSSPTAIGTNVTNLSPGSYIVRLTLTDNLGATASDDYAFTIEAGYRILKGGMRGGLGKTIFIKQ